jgi:hypothetical protein
MKARAGIVLPMLAIVVGLAMIVGAALLSNVVVIKTHVSEAKLTQVDVVTNTAMGGDYPNLPIGEGDVGIGIAYDTGINLNSSVTLGNVTVHFEIAKASIAWSDVTVQYWSGAAWLALTMTLNTSAGKLVGIFGPAGGFPVVAVYDVTTNLLVTFNATGDYVTTISLTTA